jgi:hypothetical protein
MKRLIALFALVFLLSPIVVATGQTQPDDHERLQSVLGWLEGTWEDAEGPRVFKWELRGQVLTWTPQDPDAAKAIFYWDRADKKVKVICFSADGWHISGVLDSSAEKQITLSVVNVLPSGKKVNASLTYALKDADTMFVQIKATPGQDTDRATLDRQWTLKKVRKP